MGFWPCSVLLSAGSAIIGLHNPGPKQKLARQAEDSKQEDGVQPSRSEPAPDGFAWFPDSSEQAGLTGGAPTRARRQRGSKLERGGVMADIDRRELHTLVDQIPESDVPAARKVLRALADPVPLDPPTRARPCTPWWTRFPRAMCRRRARFCARWRIQWNWRFWPRPWTTSRRRRKSEPRWRRLWPMHLPTSRLNNSGANGHEASAVPPAGGQGSGTVTKPRPGPGGGGHRAVYPNRLWRRKDADRRGAPTQVARGRLASAFQL